MEAKGYFDEDIYPAICKELSKADKSIFAAIAWFNDNDIYRILVEKAEKGVHIEVLISDSTDNNLDDFSDLVEKGSIVYKLPTTNKLMHHKFCVIDDHTLITGSYNWTWAAKLSNLENIIIIENNIKLNNEYIQIFRRIIDNEFKHITEAIGILDLMIDEINKAKEQINKYKEIPPSIIAGIEKIKSSPALSESTLSRLIESGDNTKAMVISQSRSVEEKHHWWQNLSVSWKYLFNNYSLKLGYKTDEPVEELIDYILDLKFIDCSYYKYPIVATRTNGTQYNTFEAIKDLTGLSELNRLECVFCNSLGISNTSPISGHINLKKLVCNNNTITTIEPMKLLKNLTHLEIQANPISTLKGLEYLVNIEYLKCDAKFLEFPLDCKRIKDLGLEIVDNQNNIAEFRKK